MSDKVKICLVGATAVGKTSLVSRFARSIFSDRYRTTIGVSIETREIRRGNHSTQLVIWDLSGEDEFQNVQPAYFRGAGGYLLVIDGQRAETVETARALRARLQATVGPLPFVAAINKSDLDDGSGAARSDLERLEREGWLLVYTSAKTGKGVDEAFGRLVDVIHGTRAEAWNRAT
ncbi:MAG TPA: Rab family GTPase [Polyangiaceae bacterium]|nr:Rab family GTPase [Polyangiaceae bacterium]